MGSYSKNELTLSHLLYADVFCELNFCQRKVLLLPCWFRKQILYLAMSLWVSRSHVRCWLDMGVTNAIVWYCFRRCKQRLGRLCLPIGNRLSLEKWFHVLLKVESKFSQYLLARMSGKLTNLKTCFCRMKKAEFDFFTATAANRVIWHAMYAWVFNSSHITFPNCCR